MNKYLSLIENTRACIVLLYLIEFNGKRISLFST